MTKQTVLILGIATSFCLGFTFKSVISDSENNISQMKKVTGIGGIFFKCKNPVELSNWYKTHLGFNTNEYGANFEWRQDSTPEKKGSTQWSPFAENTKYFEPSGKDFMINYRVENLDALVQLLTKEGVTIVDEIDDSEYGKFIHIMDPEGNKIELWEPKEKE